jgi:hypothetical protein
VLEFREDARLASKEGNVAIVASSFDVRSAEEEGHGVLDRVSNAILPEGGVSRRGAKALTRDGCGGRIQARGYMGMGGGGRLECLQMGKRFCITGARRP